MKRVIELYVEGKEQKHRRVKNKVSVVQNKNKTPLPIPILGQIRKEI